MIPFVRRAAPDELGSVTALLSEAFMHAELAAWLVPSLNERDKIYPAYFGLQVEHAGSYGTVEVTDDLCGAALWYVRDGSPVPEFPDHAARLAEITGRHAPRFAALESALAAHHPDTVSHHHLALLGVQPECQKSGYGTRLLNHHHAELDATGMPSYLEATGARTRQIYARRGYRPRPLYTAGFGGPPLFPMWREPAFDAGWTIS
jgi:GNAT superfamily N-acetyltransferase